MPGTRPGMTSFTIKRHSIGSFESDSEEARSAVSKDEATELENALVNRSGPRTQHPLQMLGTLPSIILSRSLMVALSERRDLDAANRVRLIFTARCTGNVR